VLLCIANTAEQCLEDGSSGSCKVQLQQPSSDLISEVVQSQLTSGKITREQLVAHAFLLLVAGACAGSRMSNLIARTLSCFINELVAN
jgi:cytochrome P450